MVSELNQLPEMEISKDPKKYEKSGLSTERADEIQANLLELMEKKKPYRNSELTLNELAAMISVTPHNLSEVINTRLRKNFFDFVNEHRLEDVIENLKNPGKSHIKVLSIAFDAGFNSKSTFNTIFKKQMGKTPSQFREDRERTEENS